MADQGGIMVADIDFNMATGTTTAGTYGSYMATNAPPTKSLTG
jgi:hypothetical protein